MGRNSPDYGIYPLHKFFYVACEKDDEGAVIAVAPEMYVKYTVDDKRFANELETKDVLNKYFEENKYTWGNTKGSCIGTYFQMLVYPKLAFKAFRRLIDTNKRHITSVMRKRLKKIVRSSKRWLKFNHKVWSIILNHLSSSSTHICQGIEMSNGIMLLSKMITKFGNTHAQCLAALLREIATTDSLDLIFIVNPHAGADETTWS